MGNKYQEKKEIIIFSVFQKDNPEYHNEDIHQTIKNVFDQNNVGYKELIGVYKGQEEKSLLVTAIHEDKVKELCKQFNQECYLYSDSDRNTFLCYPDNKVINIGTLKSTTKDIAITKDSYSYDPEYNMYWIAE